MKKSKIITIAVCMLLIFSSITACSRGSEKFDGSTDIYCINGDVTGLYMVEFGLIEDEDVLDTAKRMLKELSKPSEDIKYKPAIPKDVKVEKIDLNGQIITVYFSSEYNSISSISEKLVRAAVVQSLVNINGISAVRFKVGDNDLLDSRGIPVGIMTEDDFVKNIGSSVSSYQKENITLYFSNSEGDGLVPVSQEVKYSSNMPKEKLIVEKLIKGIKKNGLKSTIDSRVNLLSVTIKDNICYVNFDDEFLNNPVDVKPELVIYSIVNSIVEGTGADKVQFTVNGDKNYMYKEKVDLSQPFYADSKYVEGK